MDTHDAPEKNGNDPIVHVSTPPPLHVQKRSSLIVGGIVICIMLGIIGMIGFVIGKSSSNSMSTQSTQVAVKSSITPIMSIAVTNPHLSQQPTIVPTKHPTVVPTAASTSQTKTYMSSQYGFSFQYPSNLVYNNSSSPTFVSLLQKQGNLMAQRMNVQVYPGTDTMSMDEIRKKADFDNIFQSYNPHYENIQIAGHDAVTVTSDSFAKDCNQSGSGFVQNKLIGALIKANGYSLFFLVNDSCDTGRTDWFRPVPMSVSFR